MENKKLKNIRNTAPTAESTEFLPGTSSGGYVELDSVDWGAVARSYKILGLRAAGPDKLDDKLSNDFFSWLALRGDSIEFDIALRMHFDEIGTAQHSNLFQPHNPLINNL